VWRLYGGWWDGDPSHLKPARAAALAREIAELAGGPHKLVGRAERLAQAGELALACHLVQAAWLAAPDDAGVRRARSQVYRARARAETSLMARGVFSTAARETEGSPPAPVGGPRPPPEDE
jgi:alkyl sulfatase BDS1-like metallo-beta-lactamase superfamily hydrolase